MTPVHLHGHHGEFLYRVIVRRWYRSIREAIEAIVALLVMESERMLCGSRERISRGSPKVGALTLEIERRMRRMDVPRPAWIGERSSVDVHFLCGIKTNIQRPMMGD